MRNIIEAVFQTMLIAWFLGTIYGVIIAVLWSIHLGYEGYKQLQARQQVGELESFLDNLIAEGEKRK